MADYPVWVGSAVLHYPRARLKRKRNYNMTELDLYVLVCSLICLLGGGLVGFMLGQLKALIEEDRK